MGSGTPAVNTLCLCRYHHVSTTSRNTASFSEAELIQDEPTQSQKMPFGLVTLFWFFFFFALYGHCIIWTKGEKNHADCNQLKVVQLVTSVLICGHVRADLLKAPLMLEGSAGCKGHFVGYTLLVPGLTHFCLQNCIILRGHRFNKASETFHVMFKETGWRWFELCDMVRYPAGSSHQKMGTLWSSRGGQPGQQKYPGRLWHLNDA